MCNMDLLRRRLLWILKTLYWRKRPGFVDTQRDFERRRSIIWE